MKKFIKSFVLLFMLLAITAGAAACDDSGKGKNTNRNKNTAAQSTDSPPINYTETLNVYNATEYIDETTLRDFEREYGIKVEYREFESNEEMYAEIIKNPSKYDVLVPSDYMIDRLIKEDKLAKLDLSKITNMSYISKQYLNPDYDAENNYIIPYMVGTLGILYNKRVVSGTVDSWSSLWDSKYKGQILLWDSQRDIIGATLKMLGFSMNSNNDSELEQAKTRLRAGNSLFRFGSDEIRDRMVADEGALAVVYSGDAKTAIDENPNLRYVIPKEGSNKWVDGFVIMKNTKHMDAAQKFINFMCRPNIAVRNMTQTGYTSPIPGAWSEFGNNTVMFPTDEELARCEAFLYNSEAVKKYEKIWTEIKAYIG